MNKPEFYPYVLLPEEIEKIKIEGIPVPELRALPAFPEKPKKKFLGTIILIVSIGMMILLGSTHIIKSSFYANSLTYLAFFISLVSLTATVFEILHNSKAKKQYRIAVKLYNELKAEQEQTKEERRKAIEDNNNQKAIDAYRHSAINTYFKYSYNKIQIRQREYSPAQKRFLIFLEQYFDGMILENGHIVHELKKIDYAPNFILKLDNPKVNIAIDIEEPYTFEGKKVVVKKNHAEEAYKIRYKVTNELRWVCIVFNEEQVVSQPTESCKLIAHTLDEILLKEKYVEQFKNIGKVKRSEIPGQRELSAFIRNKYRENYLLAAGLIDEADFDAKEVEIRKNGSDKPEKIIKAVSENKIKNKERKKINDLADKDAGITTFGKSKSLIIEKKTEKDEHTEQLKIAKRATEKYKNKEHLPEKTEAVDKNDIDEKGESKLIVAQKDNIKSKDIDLDKKNEDVKKENLKSIESKEDENRKSETTKKVSLKKEAEKLNILYSKDKDKTQIRKQKENALIEKEKKEKERAEKERTEKVNLEKERLAKKIPELINKEELSLSEKAKQKRDEIVQKRIANEKIEKERLEKERKEKVRQEQAKLAQEKAEKEGLEKEKQERLNREKVEKEKIEQERIAKEKAEKKRKELELAQKVELEKERIEKMQKELEEKQKIEARNRLMEKYKKQIEALVANKEWDMLFDACNEAIKEFPYWEWPYYRRSTMHGNKGQFVDVIEDCNRALSINPKLTEAVYNRATAHFYLQKYEEALEDYQKCIDLNYQNSAEAYFNRGLCFQNLNQRKKAFREFVKAKNLGSIKAIEILNAQY